MAQIASEAAAPKRAAIATGKLLINGRWRDASDGATMPTTDPTTEQKIADVAKASPADAEDAIKSASEAFESGPWSWMRHEERAKILFRMADLLDARAEDFAIREAMDMGMPYHDFRREEIFGPVLPVIPFEGEEEAIRIANDTPYGLASGIQTGNLGRALRLADRIKAGTVWLNTWHKYHPNAPFGGYKMSGYGREQGAEALESYTQYKTVWANIA
jgi:acyl-CoA reductase-like NAD-dependent aldehyde dehydrogenase